MRGEIDVRIRVRTFARLAEVFGAESEVTVEEGLGIPAVLEVIGGGGGERARGLFDEEGKVHGYLIIVHNRVRVEHQDLASARLCDGDEIAILPPLAGG